MPSRSRGVRLAALALVVLTAVFVVLVTVLTPWNPLPGGHVFAAPVKAFFTPRQSARSNAFFDAVKWASWANLLLGLLVAALLAFTRLGRRLVALVRRLVRRWWLQVIALAVLVAVIQRVVTLPGGVWAQHESRIFGLSTQSWGSWATDAAKTLGVNVVLSGVGLLLLVGLARRFTRSWFIPASVGAGVLVVVLSFAYPIVFEPLFNSFTPLQDGPLRADVLDLAARDGVQVSDVLVADASRRTTALNAYVSGFGSTKRIVIYDTLLRSTPNKQVELIVAHELGHATRDDVVVGTSEGAVAAAMAVLALFLVLRPDRLRRPVGAGSVGDPAIVPVVLGLSVLVGFAVQPVQNTVSRRIEARADDHALQLTQDPRDFTKLQQRLAITNLTHLEPNPVLSFWFSDHPPTLDRIGMALAWEQLYGDTS